MIRSARRGGDTLDKQLGRPLPSLHTLTRPTKSSMRAQPPPPQLFLGTFSRPRETSAEASSICIWQLSVTATLNNSACFRSFSYDLRTYWFYGYTLYRLQVDSLQENLSLYILNPCKFIREETLL